MQKAHSNINWVNYPATTTPINETNLNAMDKSIDTIDDRVINLDSGKLNTTDAAGLVKDITLDDTTGVFTITFYNGSTKTIDTLLEKMAVNFDYDSTTQKLTITLSDGSTKEVDLSALITEYEFQNTSTVGFTVTNGKVSATVLDGSITDAKIEGQYLTNAQNAATTATTQATTSGEKALVSEGYAVGKQNGVDVDSTSPYYHNNAKWYSDNANVTVDAKVTSGTNIASITVGQTTTELYAPQGGGSGADVVEITQAEYLADKATYDAMNSFIHLTDTTGGIDADIVSYDNTESGLTSTNVQDAIDEVLESAGSGVTLTQAEYDALGSEKLTNGVKYFIKDADVVDNLKAENITYGNTNVDSALTSLNDNLTSLTNYSTTEKIVGKWFDGTNVYQKTYVGTMPTPTAMGSRYSYEKTLETFSGNVKVVDFEGYFEDSACFTIGSCTSYQTSVWYNSCVASVNNTVSFCVQTPYNVTVSYVVTIKYIKIG